MIEPNENPSGSASGTTSVGLLERARAHEAAAWARLVDLYTPLVEAWCRQARVQAADTADIRQEVFLTVERSLSSFRRERPGDSFRGWLHAIARNKITDHFRRVSGAQGKGGETAYQELLEVPAPADREEATRGDELSILYRRVLDLLSRDFEETTWRAFWCVVIESASPRQVAAELGISTNAVYLAKSRVLARLREEFAGLLER